MSKAQSFNKVKGKVENQALFAYMHGTVINHPIFGEIFIGAANLNKLEKASESFMRNQSNFKFQPHHSNSYGVVSEKFIKIV